MLGPLSLPTVLRTNCQVMSLSTALQILYNNYRGNRLNLISSPLRLEKRPPAQPIRRQSHLNQPINSRIYLYRLIVNRTVGNLLMNKRRNSLQPKNKLMFFQRTIGNLICFGESISSQTFSRALISRLMCFTEPINSLPQILMMIGRRLAPPLR